MNARALPGLGHEDGAARDGGLVRTPSASAQVAAVLRREIQRGDHAPGARLRQRDVADRLGVSTTPVREAFQVLQTEGFLTVESHRGAIVSRTTIAEVEEGYAIRIALERLAISRAAAAFDPDSLLPLEQLLARMRRADARDKWAAMDQEFHHRLNEMAAMPKLLDLINGLRSGVAFYIESAFEDPEQRHTADREHVEILAACARGDAAVAEALVSDHLLHTAQAVVRSMSRPARQT